MKSTSGREPMDWRIWLAQVAGGIGLGWAFAKSGLSRALYDAITLPLILSVLAAAALWVFALPFLKHIQLLERLPRIPVVDRALDVLDRAAALLGLGLSTSLVFEWDSSFQVGALLGAVIIGVYFAWRLGRVARREAAKYGPSTAAATNEQN